jgi:hypothetical protein
MTGINTKRLLSIMRNEYNKRLYEVIGEADVMDSQGNVVIKPGLKVRHKDSQYEYTVSTVEKNPRTGDISITLKMPEEGRFEPASGGELVLGEVDGEGLDVFDIPLVPSPDAEEEPDEVFVIDQEEFEKEYEVK